MIYLDSCRDRSWTKRTLAALGMLAAFVPVSGQAAIVETSSIITGYSYTINDRPLVQNILGGPSGSLRVTDTDGPAISELGIDYTGTLDDGSFFFLHNASCMGKCQLNITTEVTFLLTNTGTGDENIRFDSQITPGHLARLTDFNGDWSAGFRFEVLQSTAGVDSQLYFARGDSTPEASVFTSDGIPFNGANSNTNGAVWNVLDWSATNLNVNLQTIGAGQTSTLRYISTVSVLSQAPCADLANCPLGFQVAFGDPRNKGGINNRSPYGGGGSFPVIGAEYDAYQTPFSFVQQGSALPATPRRYFPIPYDVAYNPNSTVGGTVPEPATWMMMILGFGLVGRSMRRGKRKAARAILAVQPI